MRQMHYTRQEEREGDPYWLYGSGGLPYMSEEKKIAEGQGERGFIRETIQESSNQKPLGKIIQITIGMGCLFGVAAGLVFTAVSRMSGALVPARGTAKESISIPRDTTRAPSPADTSSETDQVYTEEPAFVSYGKEVFSILEHRLATVTAQNEQ